MKIKLNQSLDKVFEIVLFHNFDRNENSAKV